MKRVCHYETKLRRVVTKKNAHRLWIQRTHPRLIQMFIFSPFAGTYLLYTQTVRAHQLSRRARDHDANTVGMMRMLLIGRP